MVWRLRLTGAPALVHGPCRIDLSRKDAALLALIAFGEGGAARLAALLWPDAEPAQAMSSLRQRLWRLRQRTGGGRLAEGSPVLAAAADLVLADADDDNEAGAPLAAFAYDDLPELATLIEHHRGAARSRVALALQQQADAAESAGRIDRALPLALRVCRLQPLQESAHRRLMRLHYLRNDRAAAVAAFEACEALLKDELGLKPSAETLALLQTIEQAATPAAHPRIEMPASLLRPPRLIGRESELAALHLAWAADRIVLLEGEAGIGKSSLLAAFEAQHPGTLLICARPTDAGVPLATIARALRVLLDRHPQALAETDRRQLARALPELGPAVEGSGEGQRLLLLRSIERTVAAAVRHGLAGWVVDDLHFADAGSLHTLLALIESDTLVSLPWLLAHRPLAGASAASVWRDTLAESARTQNHRLPPLDEARIAALITSLGLPELDATMLAPPLQLHTGGNPLFVLETLRHLVTQGHHGEGLPRPASVEQLIARRPCMLSEPARELTRLLAVADSAFGVELAEVVLATPAVRLADAWRELEAAHIVRGEQFAHDLVSSVARAELPEVLAQRLHTQVADWLNAHHADPALIAHHRDRAGETAAAASAYLLAAELARAASQHDDEVTLLTHALRHLERMADAPAIFDARCELVHAVRVSQGVLAALPLAGALPALACGDAQRARASLVGAQTAMDANTLADALSMADEAERLAEAAGAAAVRFDAMCCAAQALSAAGRFGEALVRLLAAKDVVISVESGAAGTQRQINYHAALGHVLHALGDLPRALDALQTMRQLAESQQQLTDLHVATSNLSVVHLMLGEAEPGLALAQQACALSETLGLAKLPRTIDALNLGLASLASAHYGSAIEALTRCADSPHSPRGWAEYARTMLGVVWTHLGQHARAQRALKPLDEPEGLPPLVLAARAFARVEERRLRAAIADDLAATQTQEALGWAEAGGNYVFTCILQIRLAALREPAALAPLATRLMADAERRGCPPALVLAQIALAGALTRAGQRKAALAHARQAAARLQTCSFGLLYKPELMVELAQCLLQLDDMHTCQAVADSAHRWIVEHALPHVPQAFRRTFIDRQAVNVRWLHSPLTTPPVAAARNSSHAGG